MTTDFVLAYVSRKMKDIGANDNYALAFREMVVKAKEKITIEAHGQYYFLVGGYAQEYSIVSEGGIYNQLTTTTNELAHEHTGVITITSTANVTLFLQFIVAIPNNK